MTPLAREWVEKAEGDYVTARRELRARRKPNFDAACFHAQQCAEKYLKAMLQEEGLPVARTHNLDSIAKPLLALHSQLTSVAPGLRALTAFAVETRYPGKSANRQVAREAVAIASGLRKIVRKVLKAQQ